MDDILILLVATLNNNLWGVNKCITKLPVEGGEPTVPPIAKVLSQVSDDQATLNEMPDDWPVLVVTIDGPAQAEAEVEAKRYNRWRIPISIRYFTNDQDSAESFRIALRTLRAVNRSIHELTRQANTDVAHSRNGIEVIAWTVNWMGDVRDTQQSRLRSAITGELQVQDTQPYYSLA